MRTIPVSVEQTKPHALVLGSDNDPEIQAYFDSLGSGVGYADSSLDVRQRDFDFVIDLESVPGQSVDGNAAVLRFEDSPAASEVANIGELGGGDLGSLVYPGVIKRPGGERGSEFSMSENSDLGLEARRMDVVPEIEDHAVKIDTIEA